MANGSIKSVNYSPGLVPADPRDLRLFIQDELQQIKAAIDALAAGHLTETFVAPVKPRNGDLRYFDGTSYNPGSGRGVYIYKGSSWVFLG